MSDELSLVRYLGGRKFTAAVLYILLSFVLALFDRLTTEWIAAGTTGLGVFTAANLWLETRPRNE